MSSGQKVAYEDEEDWSVVKINYNLPKHWQVYSSEQSFALAAINKEKLVNSDAIQVYVKAHMKVREIYNKMHEDLKILKKAEDVRNQN